MTQDNLKTDYTIGQFMLPVDTHDAKGYASVHTTLYREEDGLDFTGSFFVYLLHPLMGSTQFELVPVDYPPGFRAKGAAVWVENEIILEIVKEIKTRYNRGITSNSETEPEKNAKSTTPADSKR